MAGSFQTNFKPARVKLTVKAVKAVYAHVDQRDGLRCRACGDYGGIAIQRHHIRGRKFHTVEDVCNLCDPCHDDLHVRIGGKRLQISGNAEQRGPDGVLNGLIIMRRVSPSNVYPPVFEQDGPPR